jgi:U4/U6 small nuclear ribonucleoprotein PRP3
MTSTTPNGLKRLHSEDELQNGSQKRARSNNGSPAPQSNGGAAAAKKPDVSAIVAEARARAAAAAARLSGLNAVPNTAAASPSPASLAAPSTMSRIEQLKARVAAATSRASAIAQPRIASPVTPSFQPPPAYDDGFTKGRGGLDVGLHPALIGDSGLDGRTTKGRQAMQPKFATTMANRRTESPAPTKKQLDLSGPSNEETRNSPYFDPALGAQTATLKGRRSRQLVFNQKGKYIQQAAALRRQAALEAMKKRIAESSRKAGIDEDLETEKAYLVQAPPDIEWWDEGLVKAKNYDSIDTSTGLKLDSEDSIITIYIQHPVALEPPQEKMMPAPKPMFLTPKEQAKLRRQRRMADLKEQQAKVRLGLEPAPPPKVKKSNLMRVLGEEAVKDPTAVEARVNREIEERAQKHLQMNEERKLTKEQALEKLVQKQEGDASKGIFMSVYKIDNLSNGRHRFKISKNAEQNALTGVCLLHPKFNLVVVEGGRHSINFYKKLMLNRIDWTENSAPNNVREGNTEALAAWLNAEDDEGKLKDLGLNKCVLLWEGEVKARAFRKWGSRVCETDAAARDALARGKLETFWTLAKSEGAPV